MAATPEMTLEEELFALSSLVETTRREIANLQPRTLKDRQIPAATDELDAVVTATATATDVILDAMETVETVAGDLQGEQREILETLVTRVYEACSFQDVTGQRITKVVATLKSIEQRVANMLKTLEQALPVVEAEEVVEDTSHDAGRALANGPSAPGEGLDQSEIDRLMNGF